MPPLKVRYITSSAPYRTTEGEPYGRRPINLDQPYEFIAQDVAARFKGNLLEFEYQAETNSLFIQLADSRKYRITFK